MYSNINMRSFPNMHPYMRMDRNACTYPNDYVPLSENSDMLVGALLGCVLCAKIISVTSLDPHSIVDVHRFPYSDETRFVPVYCTPCVKSSLGFCTDTRVSMSMITGSKVYQRAASHTGLGMKLKIRAIRSMFMVIKACWFMSDIADDDFLSIVDERSHMQLRPCEDMDFFGDEELCLRI